MIERVAGSVPYYRTGRWQQIRHAIFTRAGGASAAPWASLNIGGTVGDDLDAVRENHQRMVASLGVRADRVCSTWQVHGADVIWAQGPVHGRPWIAQADAIITDQPDTPLLMRFADCVPLLFFDPVQGVIGMAHAGWRGTAAGVAGETVRAMQTLGGSRPENIEVLIGPSISIDAFQVGSEVVTALEARYGDPEGMLRQDPQDGTYYADLWEANRRDLRAAGVQQIETMGICTFQRSDEFFSHRAEKGRTGRFGAIISL